MSWEPDYAPFADDYEYVRELASRHRRPGSPSGPRQRTSLLNKETAVANEAFLAAEVSYWRGKYEKLREAVYPLIVAYDKHRHALSPEPPVGTRFVQPKGGAWTRRDDGWHCPGEDCNNCPASWDEVSTYVRDAYRVLPGGPELKIWAGDDPEPAVGTVVKTKAGEQYTRDASGMWHPDDGCWGLVSHCRGFLTRWEDLARPLVEVVVDGD